MSVGNLFLFITVILPKENVASRPDVHDLVQRNHSFSFVREPDFPHAETIHKIYQQNLFWKYILSLPFTVFFAPVSTSTNSMRWGSRVHAEADVY